LKVKTLPARQCWEISGREVVSLLKRYRLIKENETDQNKTKTVRRGL
jgi:hypothetical protein